MPVKVIVRDNGPIRIEGEVEMFDASGNKFDLRGRTILSLCRCGHSADKPFCDTAHKTCAFESVVVARQLPEPKQPVASINPATILPKL
jgi:CDGSH-type Zn-finger protein